MIGQFRLNLPYPEHDEDLSFYSSERRIKWVIVGGESGPSARQCNIDWIREIVNECKDTGTPVFVKQLGSNCVTDGVSPDGWPVGTELVPVKNQAHPRIRFKHKKGGDPSEWPEDLRVREFPGV